MKQNNLTIKVVISNIECMKVKASLKNLRKRQGCQLVKRGKTIHIICKTNPRFKAKQG